MITYFDLLCIHDFLGGIFLFTEKSFAKSYLYLKERFLLMTQEICI